MSSDKHCCVPGCKESGDMHRVLHGFPNPAKDKERFNTWLYAIGGDILRLENERIFKYRRVCRSHFKDTYLCRNNKISNIAVPTLNMPALLRKQAKKSVNRKPLQQILELPSISSEPSTSAAVQLYLEKEDDVMMKENIGIGDTGKQCRLCSKYDTAVINLFSEEAKKNNLVQKINKYLPIVVEIHDDLPLDICQPCATAVLKWHSLVQCCIETDKLLALKFKQGSQLESSKESSYKPNGENSTKNNDTITRLPTYNTTFILKEVLNDYFKILNVNEESSDLLYVCQMCPKNPALTSIECLSDHLVSCHNTVCCDKSAIQTFIKENITLDEVLNNDEVSDVESEKQVADLPNYYCPCCESVFSSPNRLICHLNKHVEVSIDHGVTCCDSLYSDKKSFVLHLQEKHVSKTMDSEIICKTCGLAQKDMKALEKHINEVNLLLSTQLGQKEKVEPNPKCQKFIPAVCPECNKTFSSKYNMLKHMESHSNEDNSKFVCDKWTYKKVRQPDASTEGVPRGLAAGPVLHVR